MKETKKSDLISKIVSLGYSIVDSGERLAHTRFNLLQLIPPHKDAVLIPFIKEKSIAIGCGQCASMDEAREKAAQGIGIISTVDEVYRAYYAPDATDDEWEYMQCRFDRRTFDALQAEKARLHFIREDGEEEGDWKKCDDGTEEVFPFGWGNAHFGRCGDEWCLSYISGRDIDSYGMSYLYFSEKVNHEDILNAVRLTKIISLLQLGAIKEEFDCWECGCHTFWLDAGKDIYEAADNAKEKYCGC